VDSRKKQSLLVWDQHGEPHTDRQILLWNGYSETKNQRSILKALEKNSDQLRSNYLTFIKDLGQICVRDKMVVEHLMIEKGFSLWWMSLLAEKGTLKSETPLNCLKLLALNQILIEDKPNSIELVSNNKLLADSIYSLCRSLNIDFNWKKSIFLFYRFNFKNIGKKLPHYFQAIIFFIKNMFMNWNLRKSLDTNWLSGKNTFFFFSYFLNIDEHSLAKGEFFSKYWNDLPRLINKNGRKINWIHHFMKSSSITNTKIGNKSLNIFNKNIKNLDHHNFLYSFISIVIVIKTLAVWLRFFSNGILLTRPFLKEASKLKYGWISPFIIDDWKSSVYGNVAMQNIMWVYLLEESISTLPKQKMGLYLCENQGWERAFIYFWKKYGHGELIGVAHTMIRYWDLRYFDDPQVLQSKDPLAQPLPDKIALNGPVAFKKFRDANQPIDHLEKVEALRYQYIGKSENLLYSNLKSTKTLLILGDYVADTTINLLNTLEESTINDYDFIFKAHPSTKIRTTQYNSLKIKITTNSLSDVLPKVNAIISSSNTTAVIEGILLGLPVIIVLDDNNFNFSPLRGEKGVKFVRSNQELEKAIKNFDFKINIEDENKYFWLDSGLPRWKSLLGLKQKKSAEKINTTIS